MRAAVEQDQRTNETGPRGATADVREVLDALTTSSVLEDLVERLYARFFDERPDVVPLFGAHALAEREEMVQETLRSVLAWIEGETWLEGNLRALGASHVEYGVTPDMYPPYVGAFRATLAEMLEPEVWTPAAEAAFVRALEAVCVVMAEDGR